MELVRDIRSSFGYINDERESPALEIMDIVAHKGANVQYHDPYIASATTPKGLRFDSVELTTEALAEADCVVLTTNHKVFDVNFIQQHARLIVDLRNMIKEGGDKVYKL